MKNTILTILLALFFSFLNAQDTRSATITGQCFLQDETDHSGTKVLFNAVSGSAVTDSVFTDSNGDFTAGVAEGIYTVDLSRNGFIPFTIPGELNFFVDTELEPVTLLPGAVQEVADTLSGNQHWTADFQYRVTADLHLNHGDTLTIDPGVDVLFMGFYEFRIYGTLLAVGTPEDSIRFTSGQPVKNNGDWKWLYIEGDYSDTTGTGSLMANTVVEYGGGDGTSDNYANIRCWNYARLVVQGSRVSHSNRIGIRLNHHAQLTLTGSSIHHNNDNGISVYSESTADISGNDIHHNSDRGIYVQHSSTADISGNDIHDNSSYGIYVQHSSTADISGNDIHDNSSYGISVRYTSTADISGNDIHHNNFGIKLAYSSTADISGNDIYYNSGYGIESYSYSTADISGNDIHHNNYGIYLGNNSTVDISGNDIYYHYNEGIYVNQSSTANITSTLFWKNHRYLAFNRAGIQMNGSGEVAYNCFWGENAEGDGLPSAFGEVITVNANGDSSDTWSNLFMDPGVVSGDPLSNSTWEHYGEDYTLKVGVPQEWDLSYINHKAVYDITGNQIWGNSQDYYSTWTGEYFEFSNMYLESNIDCEDCVIRFEILDSNDQYRYVFLPYAPESTGPEISLPLDFDLNLTGSSVAIDAGHPDHFDPDQTIKDMGNYYFDQGTTPPHINSISADNLSGSAPLVVQFGADISGPVTERLWSFGDGGASTGANPVHMYTVAGTYTVTLTVSGPGGSDSYTAVDYITVGEQQIPPIANFTATPVLGVVPLTVNFTNLSSGDITGYNWSFGDDSSSTEDNPTHTYEEVGSYTVSLFVYGPYGTNTSTIGDFIQVVEPEAVVADFTTSSTEGIAPHTVIFSNESYGTIDSLRWSFGDGAESSEDSPVHTYNEYGEYMASLTVYGPVNTDTAGVVISITSASPIIASIEDVPEDQGGRVYVNFIRSHYDNDGLNRLELYTVERYDEDWVSVGVQSAYADSSYTVEVTTLADSSSSTDGLTQYRVIANMDEGTFISASAWGYSVDNIAPAVPTNLLLTYSGDMVVLTWDLPVDEDFQYFSVYRNGELAGYTVEPEFVEIQSGAEYYVTATDANGNESEPSDTASGYSVDVANLLGWNLVGLPVYVSDSQQLSVFPESIDMTLFSFDNAYVLESSLTAGTGYWLRFEEAGSTTITGTPINALTLSLNADWNLISGITEAVSVYAIDDPDGIIIDNTLFGFTDAYFVTEEILPAEGYWIRTFEAGDITLTSDATARIASHDYSLNANSISINGSELYFGVELSDIERLSYSLPPKPPVGAFDVRFKGDTRIAKERAEIEVMSTTESITIAYDIKIDAGEQMNWVLTSKSGTNYILEGSGEITIPSSERFILNRESVIPITFALHQNYPNPFNPITTLRYDLPTDAFVTLTIYDMLGREIKQLVNTTQQAGFKSVQWDATDSMGSPVSAGVYLYQIQAEDPSPNSGHGFVQTKKMVLLK